MKPPLRHFSASMHCRPGRAATAPAWSAVNAEPCRPRARREAAQSTEVAAAHAMPCMHSAPLFRSHHATREVPGPGMRGILAMESPWGVPMYATVPHSERAVMAVLGRHGCPWHHCACAVPRRCFRPLRICPCNAAGSALCRVVLCGMCQEASMRMQTALLQQCAAREWESFN